MTQFDQDQSAEPPRLGRYEILGEIASGGMATVFLARSLGAGGFSRLMAIKRLHPHLETDDDFVRMFLDEARLAARIRHPNVVATLDVENVDGLYIVMEYIEGVTLLQLSRAAQRVGERIPIPVAARIALDTLAGLHAAHELRDENDEFLNLVHRDVSPQNVLLGTDGAARLTDFGIAKAASRLSMTRDGQLKGKISYMAPEQTRRGEVDRRADVFTMGIVVWEILAGRRLFSGETDVEVLNQLLFEPIPRLKDHAPSLPSMLEQTVMRALERDPAARYATAAQFGDAIERATRMLGGPTNHRVVAAFIQKVAGERIARERSRIAAGAPLSEATSTGNYRALDSSGPMPSRVRPASVAPPADRAFEPMSHRSRSLRAPTMTGPVYAPDALPPRPPSVPPRALRRPSPLRPPTMPAPGAPDPGAHDPFKSTLMGVGVGGQQTSKPPPPAIIEFDVSESPTIVNMMSPVPPALRSNAPPLSPPSHAPAPSADIDHDAVTRHAPFRRPPPMDTSGRESEPATLVSMPVSMLFGPPPTNPTIPPPAPPPSQASASHPQFAEQQFAPPPQFASPQLPNAFQSPPESDSTPAPARTRGRVLIGLALLVAMAIGAGVTLYLTGFFERPSTRVTPPPAELPRPEAPLATPDASAPGTTLTVAPDASSTVADDAEARTSDAMVAPSSTGDATEVTTVDAALEAAPDDVAVAPVRAAFAGDGGLHRRRRRRRDDDDAGATTTPATTEPARTEPARVRPTPVEDGGLPDDPFGEPVR